MKYPIIYDKKETSFTGLGIAVLNNAANVKVKEVINGEFKLSLILPRTDPKWQHVQSENFIKVYDISQGKDQLFRIRGFTEERDNKGKLTSNIQAEHIWYDAITCKHLPSVELIGKTPDAILQEAFSGTRFSIGIVEITTPTDIIMSKTNPSKVAQQLIDNVGGELIRDNWTINLVKQRGSNKGVQFRFGKNIESIKRQTDGSTLITRLYPYGKDGLQIDSVNGGKPYIDSPLIGNYDRPIIGYKDYKDIDDPAELLQNALKEWSTEDNDGIDKPHVTYSGSFIELSKHKEYGSIETFGLGDTAKVIDSGIDADTSQRIVEYEFYPYEPQRSNVGLANFEIKVYRNNNIGSIISNANQASQTLDSITTSAGNINATAVDNILTRLQTEINQMVQSALIHCQADMYVDSLENPQRALIFGNGIFAIANSKKPNGDWNWRTIATGDKLIADEVDALWIYTGKLIGNIIQTAEGGARLEFSKAGFLQYDSNGVQRILIQSLTGFGAINFYEADGSYSGRLVSGNGMALEPANGRYLGLGAPLATVEFTGLQVDMTSVSQVKLNGISGSFTTTDGHHLVVSNGIVTSIG
ncbi:MAG: phage tail spike protein [Bacillota bacterium]|nr:phage tail spike protein [Bacillota bacterium]